MFEREQREHREEGGDSASREGEAMDDAHSEPSGHATNPEPGHPYGGEGVGLPKQGPGRAAMESTPPIGTEDQGEPTKETAEKKGIRGGGKED